MAYRGVRHGEPRGFRAICFHPRLTRSYTAAPPAAPNARSEGAVLTVPCVPCRHAGGGAGAGHAGHPRGSLVRRRGSLVVLLPVTEHYGGQLNHSIFSIYPTIMAYNLNVLRAVNLF